MYLQSYKERKNKIAQTALDLAFFFASRTSLLVFQLCVCLSRALTSQVASKPVAVQISAPAPRIALKRLG